MIRGGLESFRNCTIISHFSTARFYRSWPIRKTFERANSLGINAGPGITISKIRVFKCAGMNGVNRIGK
jgi:hypothetical protein